MKVSFEHGYPQERATLVLKVHDDGQLDQGEDTIDTNDLQGSTAYQISASKTFTGKRGQIHKFIPPQNSQWKEVILVGAGDRKTFDHKTIQDLAAPLYKALDTESHNTIYLKNSKLSAYLADSLVQQTYSFKKYQKEKAKQPAHIRFASEFPQEAKEIYEPLKNITEGNFWAADLANEPANMLNPESYAHRIQKEFSGTNVTVKVIEAAELEKMGAGAIVAVGQGSKTPSCMVIMEYDGTNGKTDRPIGIVGKGVTFDTGGYSIKPSAGMDSMKFDMGGSAAVVGAMKALAANNVKEKVVAIVGLAENMVSSKAYLPGDVLTAMNGMTIEIGNTDAEGRLVMADCLTHLQREYNPRTLLDTATLTGACVAALGHEYAGIMSHQDSLWKRLRCAGLQTNEKGWRLPLNKVFANAMKGKTADLSNMANIRYAGASTAAEFLHNFIEKDEKGQDKCDWAHIDIAGPGIPANGISNGFGVRLLTQFVENEAKPADQKKKRPAGPSAKP